MIKERQALKLSSQIILHKNVEREDKLVRLTSNIVQANKPDQPISHNSAIGQEHLLVPVFKIRGLQKKSKITKKVQRKEYQPNVESQ